MDNEFLDKILENIFFVASEPVTLGQLYETLNIQTPNGEKALEASLLKLQDAAKARGLELAEVGEGYLMTTQSEYAKWIRRYQSRVPIRLTEESKLTLAIVAYKQPIKKSEIESIRGVDCESVLDTLRNLGLIQITGELSGAYLYGTTSRFLTLFNLKTLSDLPPLGAAQTSSLLNK